MDTSYSISPDQAAHLLRLYLKAKDENRPHFMADAFDKEAVVEMVLHTGATCGQAASYAGLGTWT